ncbi:MAG: CpsD/CapB family tyrosine-protein kinase [Dehalococcoidia bacterium]
MADAYRIVRTNLEFVRAGRGRFTVLVTSAKPEEGKSTTSANLAVILAQTGRRVALVDADMRRPSLHKVFGLPNKAGLSSLFLMDDPQPAGLLNQMPYDNLRVLTSGPLPPNPTELLASPRMERVLAALKDEAEIVVFDSPPLLGAADASVLAAQVDGVVLVVDAGRTRSGSVAMAATAVRRAQAPLWGVVLNKLRSDSDAYYDQSPYYGARQVADDPSHTLAAFRTAEEGARP